MESRCLYAFFGRECTFDEKRTFAEKLSAVNPDEYKCSKLCSFSSASAETSYLTVDQGKYPVVLAHVVSDLEEYLSNGTYILYNIWYVVEKVVYVKEPDIMMEAVDYLGWGKPENPRHKLYIELSEC